ncbi:hypothetical protein QE152_g37545 [Popillia japonica]|uniref:Uncharacterized protein n=1 Tax=Popillia japonica TaxID=7064 RepID=A0AAW1IA65_POPJA
MLTGPDDIGRDEWDDGYRIAAKKVGGYPPSTRISMAIVKKLAEHLFPKHEPLTFVIERKEFRHKCINEELKTAGAKLKCIKPPGSGDIAAEVINLLLQTN